MRGKNIAEIIFVIILVVTIAVIHSLPMIAQSMETVALPITKIKITHRKEKIFTPSETQEIVAALAQSPTTTSPNTLQKQGNPHTLLENPQITDKIESMFHWQGQHTIHLVRATMGHTITPGKINMLHHTQGQLSPTKNIWYIFLNSDWELEDGWIFKENNLYYVPEEGCVLVFEGGSDYEMYPLRTDKTVYFILVYNF